MENAPKSFLEHQSSYLDRAFRYIDTRLNNVIEVAKNISFPGAIKTVNLADSSVTQVKLADSSVTQSKLAPNIAGNGPVFSAHHTVVNFLPLGVYTKVIYDIEDIDTNNNYNPATGVFTPTVAGYYLISACIQCDANNTLHLIAIYKNSALFLYGKYENLNEANAVLTVTGIVFCNGSSDFIDVRCFSAINSNTSTLNGNATLFQGCLIRAA